MTRPLCQLERAALEDRENPAECHLHCEHCGSVTFTATAYKEAGNLSANEKSLLSEYCHRHSRDPEFPMITHVRLREIIEEMSATRAEELMRAELNKDKKS